MEKKLHALLQVARTFQTNQIRWQVGGSCMLFLRGQVASFRDIDLVVEEDDWNLAISALQSFAVEQTKSPQAMFTTKQFTTFLLQEVEIDLMAGFGILYQGKTHSFPLEDIQAEDTLLFEDTVVYLAPLRQWLDIYRLMERKERVTLIETALAASSSQTGNDNNYPASSKVTLVKPTITHWNALQAYKQEMLLTTDVINGGGSLEEYATFEDWKHHLDSYANRHTMDKRSGYVEGSQWLLMEEKTQRILGMVNIRHYLNERLLHEGGHIGYSIRPNERRKGYGSQQLQLALQYLRQMGCRRALVTCDEQKIASMKTIEHNGGRLENKRLSLTDGRVTRRYWIELVRKDERE